MSYYKDYMRRLVGGTRAIPKNRLKPGQIVTFTYTSSDANKRTRRKFYRIVFILNTWRDAHGIKVHALNLEYIPWALFLRFIKRVLVTDTVSLLKRRYEIVSPVIELINRPRAFYNAHIKKIALNSDCYRTYSITEIKIPRVGYLNYRSLFHTKQSRDMLISKQDKLEELQRERKLLESMLNISIKNITDKQFTKIVIERFGSVPAFIEVYRQIEELTEAPEGDTAALAKGDKL